MRASRTVAALAPVLAALALFAPGAARAAPAYRLRLGYVISAGTPIDMAARRLAQLVKERTDGEVEIAVHPGGTLGGERAMIEGVQLGTIDMSFTTTGAIGGFAPEFHVLDLPYLFPSYEAAYTYLDGELGQKLLALLDRRGVHGLGFLENGWRSFTSSRRPLRLPRDLKGQKIRVMESPVYMGLIRALSATPTPMAYSELPRALAGGVIDGQENPAVNIYSARMFESQPFMIRDQHTYNVFIFKVNGKLWRSFPERIRRVLEDTAAEVRDFERKLNREADGAFVRRLEAKGMQVHVPTPAELRGWQAATAPVYDETRRFLGGTWVADTVQFRKDWDAGRYRAEEQRYVERFARIAVPLEEVLRDLP
ncbi:MAG: TRAP transporter substrate-binding protein [Anaeromyxobacteraceae bacterium]